MASSEIRAGKAFVELNLKDGIGKGLDRVAAKMKAVGEGISSVGKKMAGLGVAIVAPLLLAAHSFASMGDEITKASLRTGVGVKALQELKYAAEQNQVGFEDLQHSIAKMQKFIVASSGAAGDTTGALKALGLTVQQLKGMKPEDQFALFAERLSKLGDQSTLVATGSAIMGKSFAQILPLILEGADGLKALQKRAEDLGLVMSKTDTDAATVFGDTVADLTKQIKALVNTVGATVANALQPFATAATHVMRTIINWAAANRPLVVSLLTAGVAFVAGGVALLAFGKALTLVGQTIIATRAIVAGLGTAYSLLTNPIVLVGAAVAGLAYWFLAGTQTGQAFVTYLTDQFHDLRDTAKETFDGITDALGAGDIELAAQILWTGLKTAWTQGTADLMVGWYKFKALFVQTAAAAFYGVQEIYASVSAALQTAFAETANFFVDSWHSAIHEVTQLFDFLERREVQAEKDRIARDLAAGKITPAQAKKQTQNVDAQSDQVLQARNRQDEEDSLKRQAALKQRLADIDAQKVKAIDEINKKEQAISAGATANAADDIKALEAKKKALQRELDELRAKSSREKIKTDQDEAKRQKQKPKDLNFPDLLPPQVVKSNGLFNAAALQSLEGNASLEYQKRTAKAVEELLKEQKARGKPTFR